MSLKRMRGYVDIAPSVCSGDDCLVWAFTVIGERVSMGARCSIGSHCYLGHDVQLGDDVRLQSHVFIPNRVILGSRVFVGPGVLMTDDRHPRVNHTGYIAEPPIIEDDVSIGAGAILLPGVKLGRCCVIGAGAVVTHNVPPGETWTGLPARKRHRWPEPPGRGWLRPAPSLER